MKRIAFLNSRYIEFKNAKIHIEDRGLQFSDSVYEVVPFYKHNLIDFDFHFLRLKFSLKELNIRYYPKKIYLHNIFKKLIKINNLKSGIVYLQVTRGVQDRDHSYKNNLKPNVIIYIQKKLLNIAFKKIKAKKAITYNDLRWKRRDIKSVSLLGNVIAKKEASIRGAYEAILIDKGKITEATSSNVWMVKNKTLITHPANSDILKGVTREAIKKLIIINKLQLKEKTFTKNQLYNADEVFITSSTSFITPIIKIDSKLINNGKIGNISSQLALIYSNLFLN